MCVDCGTSAPLHGRGRCHLCYGKHWRQSSKRVCDHCHARGNIRPGTGVCGRCHRAARPRKVREAKPCIECQRLTAYRSHGRCANCRSKRKEWAHGYADGLARRLSDPPPWLAGFADYLIDRLSPGRSVAMLIELKWVLESGGRSPTAVLERTRLRDRNTIGALARALEAYFVGAGLALPLDHDEQTARLRRARRVAEVPESFRALAARYERAQVEARERSLRAGTKPRSDRTLEINLMAVRDLAIFITDQRDAQGWESVAVADVEAFLATKSASNGVRQLHCLRAFFRWARTERVIAVEPTRGIQASSNFAFRGRVLDGAAQRALFRRWSHDTGSLDADEAAAGLLGLLHGASAAELRAVQVHDIDLSAGTIRLGSRPERTPLDPPTSLAIKRCLEGRTPAQQLNPHLFVNRSSKVGHEPVSQDYLELRLARVGVTPRQLRATRLAHLVTVMDPILVASAFGIKNGAALHYLADSVDEGRIANL